MFTSKKDSLQYQRFHSKSNPGQISEKRLFEIPEPKRNFSEVIKYLTKQKYVHLTKDGYCHLLPKGLFIQEALEAYAIKVLEIEGALRYRFSSIFSTDRRDGIWTLISKFEKQMYRMLGSREQYLKYASDPLIFEYLKGRKLQTPLKIYSPDYFFRDVQRGELKPLIQSREFYMTDFHFFCEPLDLDSYIDASLLNKKTIEKFADTWYLSIDTNVAFFESHAAFFSKMLECTGVDAVINVMNDKTHYYSIQSQFMVDYYHGNKTQFANLQFDQRNGEIFGITSSHSKKPVSVIHGTLLGRTEKILALVVGKQLEREQKPILPEWLSPIVVRVIPIGSSEPVKTLSGELELELQHVGCRYDVDKRDLSLEKRVREAEHDWIPFQIVIGEHEVASKTVSVRDRRRGTNVSIPVKEFLTLLSKADIRSQLTPRCFEGNSIY